jgi:hypothetical protein
VRRHAADTGASGRQVQVPTIERRSLDRGACSVGVPGASFRGREVRQAVAAIASAPRPRGRGLRSGCPRARSACLSAPAMCGAGRRPRRRKSRMAGSQSRHRSERGPALVVRGQGVRAASAGRGIRAGCDRT